MPVHCVTASAVIRPMQARDIDAVLQLQAEAYHDVVLEDAAAFLHKLAVVPAGCFVADDEPARDQGICAYVFSHPGRWQQPPTIGSASLPTESVDCWYLHDLVVAERVRGQRLAQRLLAHVQAQAHAAGFTRMALTSLKQAVDYWQACGFVPVSPDAGLQHKLQPYGEGACYMAQAV